MANRYKNLNELFVAIANSIREKKNSSTSIVADSFPTEILSLQNFNYANQKVTSIPNYGFYGDTGLRNVDCYNVTSIGANAFENCTNLQSIVIYDTTTSVGANAFKGCPNVTIYCMFNSKPSGWNSGWNPDNRPVVWLSAVTATWDVSASSADSVVAKRHDSSEASMYALMITGTGYMKDYPDSSVPWFDNRPNITTIRFNGKTNFSKRAITTN